MSSTPYTFDAYPPERGQMVQLDNKWHMVECHPLTRDITDEYHGGGPEIIDRQEYWSTGIREALEDGRKLTLLLPSPRQCRDAGLNIPKCLRFVLPGCYPGDSRLMRVLEADKLVIEAMDLPLVGRPWFVRASGFSDDPAVLETAANWMHALQSWLAGWNKEAANGE